MLESIKAFLSALKYIKSFIEWWQRNVLRKKGEANLDKVDKANEAISEANKIEDEAARLEAKRKAMKEMEDALSGK